MFYLLIYRLCCKLLFVARSAIGCVLEVLCWCLGVLLAVCYKLLCRLLGVLLAMCYKLCWVLGVLLAVCYKLLLVVRCAMALLHSRIRRVFYMDAYKDGALGSRYKLHVHSSLNHHFEVYRCRQSQVLYEGFEAT